MIQRTLFKLLFPFTKKLFWEKALSSAEQEAVRKYPTFQDKDFPILLLQHVATQPLLPPKACCLPGVLMQTPNTSLELLQAVEQPVPGQTGTQRNRERPNHEGNATPKEMRGQVIT